jgi:hypothetical protein
METPNLLNCLLREGFTCYKNFFNFVHYEQTNEATCGSKKMYKLKPIIQNLNEAFSTVYTAVTGQFSWISSFTFVISFV